MDEDVVAWLLLDALDPSFRASVPVGARVPLGVGRHTIGRSADAMIQVHGTTDDQLGGRRSYVLEVTADSVALLHMGHIGSFVAHGTTHTKGSARFTDDASFVLQSVLGLSAATFSLRFERIAIRLASPADAPTLVSLIAKYYAFDGIPFDAARIEPATRELLGDPALGRAWLVEDAGVPVGYVVLVFGFDIEVGGRLGTVTDLYLEPSHRRRGLGGRMLDRVEATLRDMNVGALELQVERDNAEARAFYEKRGMIATDRIPLEKRLSRPS